MCPGQLDAQTSPGNGLPNLRQTTRPYNNQQKKKRTELAELWTSLSQLTTE